jgi:calpain-7
LKNEPPAFLTDLDMDNLRIDGSSPVDENETENNKFLNKLAVTRPLSPSAAAGGSGGGRFGKEEISVLRHGSFINGREYVPFFPEIDSKERFFFPVPFTHKEGKLALAASQRERFNGWARPDEIFEKPTLMMLISSFSVKQTCISDCSFVASLTVCAQYERKFNKRILSK